MKENVELQGAIILEFSKEHLSCNKLRTYGMGKHHMSTTLQREK